MIVTSLIAIAGRTAVIAGTIVASAIVRTAFMGIGRTVLIPMAVVRMGITIPTVLTIRRTAFTVIVMRLHGRIALMIRIGRTLWLPIERILLTHRLGLRIETAGIGRTVIETGRTPGIITAERMAAPIGIIAVGTMKITMLIAIAGRTAIVIMGAIVAPVIVRAVAATIVMRTVIPTVIMGTIVTPIILAEARMAGHRTEVLILVIDLQSVERKVFTILLRQIDGIGGIELRRGKIDFLFLRIGG
jgi:hypothetical protein